MEMLELESIVIEMKSWLEELNSRYKLAEKNN